MWRYLIDLKEDYDIQPTIARTLFLVPGANNFSWKNDNLLCLRHASAVGPRHICCMVISNQNGIPPHFGAAVPLANTRAELAIGFIIFMFQNEASNSPLERRPGFFGVKWIGLVRT